MKFSVLFYSTKCVIAKYNKSKSRKILEKDSTNYYLLVTNYINWTGRNKVKEEKTDYPCDRGGVCVCMIPGAT